MEREGEMEPALLLMPLSSCESPSVFVSLFYHSVSAYWCLYLHLASNYICMCNLCLDYKELYFLVLAPQ